MDSVQEPHTGDDSNELYKPDFIFVKEVWAFVVDATMWYKNTDTPLEEATREKVKKYQHHHKHIQELTNVADMAFVSFPCGAWGKCYHRNHKFLRVLGLPKSMQEKAAQALACRALCTSVDIVHVSVSKAHAAVITLTHYEVSAKAMGTVQPQASWHQAWIARGHDWTHIMSLIPSKWDKILLILTEVDRSSLLNLEKEHT